MKAITLIQPWASLIVLGHKTIETRSWHTNYKGEILIHAGLKKIIVDESSYQLLTELENIPGFVKNYPELPYGAIIGKATIEESFLMTEEYISLMQAAPGINKQQLSFGHFEPGRYAWRMSNPIVFKKPIPCRGALSLWNVPEDIIKLIDKP